MFLPLALFMMAVALTVLHPPLLHAGAGGPGYVHQWTEPFEFLGPGREMDNDWRLKIPDVQIGLLGSFAGGGGVYGRAMEEGVMMALDEVNDEGGLFGRKVVIVKGDDENDMGKNGHETVRLIDEGVWGILGSVHSGCTHVAARITLKSEVPQLTSISTDPTIGLINSPWMFRCLVDDRGQGRALADLIFKKLKYKKVGLVMHNNRYGTMGGKEISSIAKAQKTPVVFKELFESDQTDFRKIIKKIKSSKVEAIIIWGLYGPAGNAHALPSGIFRVGHTASAGSRAPFDPLHQLPGRNGRGLVLLP